MAQVVGVVDALGCALQSGSVPIPPPLLMK
jgi:hypothetical protein